MIRRLMEQSYFAAAEPAPDALLEFWLAELRTPELLVRVAAEHPALAVSVAGRRPAVQAAMLGRTDDVRQSLELEEQEERKRDREYWQPLKQELESIRLKRNRPDDSA
jgi:hypothetical protein